MVIQIITHNHGTHINIVEDTFYDCVTLENKLKLDSLFCDKINCKNSLLGILKHNDKTCVLYVFSQ